MRNEHEAPERALLLALAVWVLDRDLALSRHGYGAGLELLDDIKIAAAAVGRSIGNLCLEDAATEALGRRLRRNEAEAAWSAWNRAR